MDSLNFYNIPSIIIALLGVLLLLFGGWLGIDIIVKMYTTTNPSDGVGMIIVIAVGGILSGFAGILFGIWSILENEFKLPMAVFFGLLTVGFLRLGKTLDIIGILAYDEIVQLLTISVLALIWCLLWYFERRWEMSFSQLMD